MMRLSVLFGAVFASAATPEYLRPNARVLLMEVPLSGDASAIGKLAVPPGLKLDTSRPGRIIAADYPRADIGWAGLPGQSARENVPHREVRVQLPVTQKGSGEWWQDVYAVITDDVAVLLARDSRGVPAKIGGVSISGETSVAVSAERRGVSVVSVSATRGASIDPASLGTMPFGRTLNLFGTQAMLGTGEIPKSNNIYLASNTTAAVSAAWQVTGASLSFADDVHEPLATLFGTSAKASSAWWLEADTDAAGAPPPAFAGAAETGMLGPVQGLEFFMSNYLLRYGGKPVRTSPEQYDNSSKYTWQDGRFVWALLQLNASVVEAQLPPGMTLADDKARLFCSYYPNAHLYAEISNPAVKDENFPYHEFALRFYVNLGGKKWRHVVYILVDDEQALVPGRDMLGTPKKMANFTFPDSKSAFAQGASAAFSIDRRGVPVVEFSGTVGENRTDPAPGLTDDINDVSVFGTQFPLHFGAATNNAGQPAYAKWSGSSRIIEARRIDSPSVKFSSAAAEPLQGWFVDVPPLDAGFVRMDYGKAADLRTRPNEGKMAEEGAEAYWRNTYQIKYGGQPLV
eukprot:Hpha_TRINITY_DN12006_c0_g1::TRINITY_DN12006_c0_g1_i1::g.141235::m.141235